ncbi:hypothetical protein V8E54_007258 [Elaphomyces granulatus]
MEEVRLELDDLLLLRMIERFLPTQLTACLEEEFPRFATATENIPPEITEDNIRQRYNDYQCHIDWCANRSPCGICGGSFQSDSVSLYSQQKLMDLENRHELDSCAIHDDGVTICNTCGHDLEANGRLSVPKFSGANWVNKPLYQHRPSCLPQTCVSAVL